MLSVTRSHFTKNSDLQTWSVGSSPDFPTGAGIIGHDVPGQGLRTVAATVPTHTNSPHNVSCVSVPQPLVHHVDLQDASARRPLQTARQADGGLGGPPRARALHLQPGPHHQQHPALALLRQVRAAQIQVHRSRLRRDRNPQDTGTHRPGC